MHPRPTSAVLSRLVVLLLAPLALLGVMSTVNLQPSAVGQESDEVDLTEAIDLGTVRRTQRASVVETQWTSGVAGFEYTTGAKIEREIHVDEWINGIEDGRISSAWRSYRAFAGQRTEAIDWGNGPEETTTDLYDSRVSYTFPFKLDAKGNRELQVERSFLWDDADYMAMLVDRDPLPLPGGRVKVGATWKVAGNNLPVPGDFLNEATAKTFTCTATLAEVGDVNGVTVAAIKLDGSSTRTIREESALGDGTLSRDLVIKSTFTGEAGFDIDAGRMLAFAWSGTVSVTGQEFDADVKGTATFTERWTYAYGRVQTTDGPSGPEDEMVEAITAKPHGKLAEGHIVVGRQNGNATRLVVYDPAARKELATVLTLPGTASIGDLAVSPDRKLVAFESSLNNLISIAESNVFIFNLETAKLDQITPYWASGDGLGKAIETEQTCTLKGQIVWTDDDPLWMRDRNDGFTGFIRVDQTACVAAVNVDGTFELAGVPVGTPVMLEIKGTIPFGYSNGNWRPALAAYVGATMANMTLETGTHDLGTVRLFGSHMSIAHDAPGFVDNGTLLTQLSGWSSGHKITLVLRSYEEAKFSDDLLYMTGGFAVSRDGRLGMCHDSSGSGGARFSKIDGSAIWVCEDNPASFSVGSEGAWLIDGSGWICTADEGATMGDDTFGAPALIFASPSDKAARVAQAWPQLIGQSVVSVAVNKAGTMAWLVVHAPQANDSVFGDVWAWDAVNDTMTQITTYHDVVAVGGWGR